MNQFKMNLCVILHNDKQTKTENFTAKTSEINSSDNCFEFKCLFHFESIICH